MRKISIILSILILSVSAIFADDTTTETKAEPKTQHITFKSVVAEDDRSSIEEANDISRGGLFVLAVSGVIDANGDPDQDKFLMSDFDISEHDIDIEFSVVQTERVQTIGKINLTATVGNLVLDSDNSKTVEASATGAWETAKSLARYEDAITVTAVTADNVVSIEIKYIDDTKEVPAQPLGTFVAKWAREPGAANNPGMYKANVTLSYTVE